MTELVACTWLQCFLQLLKDAYPKLRVELEVDLSSVIDARLMQGQLDLVFQTDPFKATTFTCEPFGFEGYCWVANPDLGVALGGPPSVEDLFKHTILTHAKHTQAGHALHRYAEARGLNSSQIVHSSALSVCVPMVFEGLGVALLPDPLSFFARYAAQRAPLFVGKAAKLAAQAMQSAETTAGLINKSDRVERFNQFSFARAVWSFVSETRALLRCTA